MEEDLKEDKLQCIRGHGRRPKGR